MNDAATFYTNRVLKDYKDNDNRHVDWVRSYLQLWTELQAYIKEHHTTGLVWSKSRKGKYSSTVTSMCLRMMFSHVATSNVKQAINPFAIRPTFYTQAAHSLNIVFTDKGLRHVLDGQKTHKNPELRSQGGVARQSPTKSHTPSPTSPKAPPQNHFPVLELEGKKWRVVLGKVPTISVNKTEGCHIYLSEESLDCEIVSAKTSEVNILVPQDGDYQTFINFCDSTQNEESHKFKPIIPMIYIRSHVKLVCPIFPPNTSGINIGRAATQNGATPAWQIGQSVQDVRVWYNNNFNQFPFTVPPYFPPVEVAGAQGQVAAGTTPVSTRPVQQQHANVQQAGREYTIPSPLHRLIAEIVDFFILFFIKASIVLSILHFNGIKEISKFAMNYIVEEIDEDTSIEELQKMMMVALVYRVFFLLRKERRVYCSSLAFQAESWLSRNRCARCGFGLCVPWYMLRANQVCDYTWLEQTPLLQLPPGAAVPRCTLSPCYFGALVHALPGAHGALGA
ncbi:UNVERIFIED_CONTAM: hypothetical protein FKN15_051785 [Acipenser sinensis]